MTGPVVDVARANINVTHTNHGLLVRRRLGPSQHARLAAQRAGWLLESID